MDYFQVLRKAFTCFSGGRSDSDSYGYSVKFGATRTIKSSSEFKIMMEVKTQNYNYQATSKWISAEIWIHIGFTWHRSQQMTVSQ